MLNLLVIIIRVFGYLFYTFLVNGKSGRGLGIALRGVAVGCLGSHFGNGWIFLFGESLII